MIKFNNEIHNHILKLSKEGKIGLEEIPQYLISKGIDTQEKFMNHFNNENKMIILENGDIVHSDDLSSDEEYQYASFMGYVLQARHIMGFDKFKATEGFVDRPPATLEQLNTLYSFNKIASTKGYKDNPNLAASLYD